MALPVAALGASGALAGFESLSAPLALAGFESLDAPSLGAGLAKPRICLWTGMPSLHGTGCPRMDFV